MIGYIFKGIAIVLIVLVIRGVVVYARKPSGNAASEMTKHSFEMRLPRMYPLLFFGGSVFFGILLILMATVWNNETATWGVYLIFGFFVLAPLILGIVALTGKIVVNGDVIKVYSFFAKVKEYHFSQITHIKYNQNQNSSENVIKVYSDTKKIFSFSDMYIGYEYMLLKLGERNLLEIEVEEEE